MAIITEEPDDDQQQQPKQSQIPPTKPRSKPKSTSTTSTTTQPPNPFSFWFHFTLSVSLITLAFFFFFTSSLSPQDPKTWFLSLPNTLRQHYSKGRTIKVQTRHNQPPIEVFTVEEGPTPTPSENVVIVHGHGLSSYSYRQILQSLSTKGVRAIAIDLPGNGFSDKSTEDSVEGLNGIFGRFSYVYSEIKEKGVFWAFDQIVETGQIPYEEIQARMSKRKVTKPIDMGPQEMGRVLGQVIDTLGLAPVHLVLHDSALGLSANWVSEKPELVRSLTLVDTAASSLGAFPIWVLEIPVIRDVVLGFPLVFAKVVNFCCSKRIGVLDVDTQRVLLKGRDGRKAVVAIGKNLNSSFDVAEWGGSDGLKDMPMQLLWSRDWSEEWSREGNRVASALPQATFVTHSGGRWAQEDAAVEIAEKISEFVLSLPKTARKVDEQESSIPEHVQKMLDEAKSDGHDHLHHHGHGHGHDHHDEAHVHGAGGYMDAYGLGHEPHGWQK